MHKRENPLAEPPRRHPYIVAEHPTLGTFVLRLPSLGRLAAPAEIWRDACQSQDIARIETATASIIRLAWADPVLEFDCEIHEGDKAWEELYESGVTLVDALAIATGIVDHVTASAPTEREVKSAVRFFGPEAPTEPAAST